MGEDTAAALPFEFKAPITMRSKVSPEGKGSAAPVTPPYAPTTVAPTIFHVACVFGSGELDYHIWAETKATPVLTTLNDILPHLFHRVDLAALLVSNIHYIHLTCGDHISYRGLVKHKLETETVQL